MEDVRIALAQTAPTLGDWAKNLETHLDAANDARRAGARVVVFPELSLAGYNLRDIVPEVAMRRDAPALARLAEAAREIDIVAGFVEESPGHRFFNAAGYFSGGRLVHVHRKLFLPTYGMFQEGREFARGETLRAFDTAHGRAGLLVCEDLWHQTCAWLLAQDGAQLIYALSNGPTRGARPGREITSIEVWRQLLQVTAQFLTSYVVFANRVGCEDGLTFGGGSMVVDPFGRVIAALPALDEGFCTVDLPAETVRRARSAYPLLRDADLALFGREAERVLRERCGLGEGERADAAGREGG
jgi:predicted amidohydrolase